MIIISVFAALLIAGVLVIPMVLPNWDGLTVMATIVGGFGLAMSLLFLPMNRMAWQSTFVEVEAIRASRASDDPMEGAAWRLKAAEVNAKLASGRYYNRTVFDIWIPDEIDSIEPIK